MTQVKFLAAFTWKSALRSAFSMVEITLSFPGKSIGVDSSFNLGSVKQNQSSQPRGLLSISRLNAYSWSRMRAARSGS
jgi:hypothetical protein